MWDRLPVETQWPFSFKCLLEERSCRGAGSAGEKNSGRSEWTAVATRLEAGECLCVCLEPLGTLGPTANFRMMEIDAVCLAMSESVVWLAGHGLVLAAAILVVLIWCLVGLATGMPNQWFLLSNGAGTLVSLFILLVIQHSQNRDMRTLQVKVDELIWSSNARNHMIGIERLETEDLATLPISFIDSGCSDRWWLKI